jgi:hypothetical protein
VKKDVEPRENSTDLSHGVKKELGLLVRKQMMPNAKMCHGHRQIS